MPPFFHRLRHPGDRLWRLLLVAWGTLAVVDLAVQPVRGVARADLTDFVALDTGAWLLRHGQSASLYDVGAQAHAQAAVLGHPLTAGLDLYGNPAPVAWLLQPLAALPLATAVLLVTLAALLAVAVSTVLMSGLVDPSRSRPERLGLSLVCVALLPAVDQIGYGQLVLVVAVGAALATRLAAHRGDALAVGLLLTPLAVKPQLVWLVVPVLLVAQAWRAAAGLTVGLLAWISGSVAIIGVGGMVQWVRDVLPSGSVDYATQSGGVPGVFVAAGLPHQSAALAAAACAAFALALAWRFRRTLRRDPPVAVVVGIGVSTLCSPHIWGGDIALVGVGLVLVARTRPRAALLGAVGFGLAGIMDTAGIPHLGHIEALAGLASLALLLATSGRLSEGAQPLPARLAPALPAPRRCRPAVG